MALLQTSSHLWGWLTVIQSKLMNICFLTFNSFFLTLIISTSDGKWSRAYWQPQFNCLRCPVRRRHQPVTGANAPDSNRPCSDSRKRQTTICRRSLGGRPAAKRNTSCDAFAHYLGDTGGGKRGKKHHSSAKRFVGGQFTNDKLLRRPIKQPTRWEKWEWGGRWDKTGGSAVRTQHRHTGETQGEMTFQSPSWLMWCVCVLCCVVCVLCVLGERHL